MPRWNFISLIQMAMLLSLWMVTEPLLGQHVPESKSESTSATRSQASLIESGKVVVGGVEARYRIRNLPVNSFPELPGLVAEALNARGCVIPQTYEAKRPENVIHGSFERAGSSDWAVLCLVKGEVSLLVFFGTARPSEPAVLASSAIKERLQDHDVTGELGFNWGVDSATPGRVHDAEAGVGHRPAAPDHDSIADSIIDHRTVYHLYRNGAWDKTVVE